MWIAPLRADDVGALRALGEEIMFSSNDTPPEEFSMAYRLGATHQSGRYYPYRLP